MAANRKLSDGVLPCGRCGGKVMFFRSPEVYMAECEDCHLKSPIQDTIADTIIAWNNLAARTHPEPEDYLELLEECKPPLLGRPDTPAMWNHLNLMFDLQDEYGDTDD